MGSLFSKEPIKQQESEEDAAIRAFVTGLIKDANLTAIPDVIEMKVYTNIIKVGMAFLSQTIKGASVEFMNHRITFKMEPI